MVGNSAARFLVGKSRGGLSVSLHRNMAEIIGLDGDHFLNGRDFTTNKQHIGDVDMFGCWPHRPDMQVAAAKAKQPVPKQVATILFNPHPFGVEAPRTGT